MKKMKNDQTIIWKSAKNFSYKRLVLIYQVVDSIVYNKTPQCHSPKQPTKFATDQIRLGRAFFAWGELELDFA